MSEEIKCPKCERNMVLRESEYGKFYGCSTYPACTGIVKLPKEVDDDTKYDYLGCFDE